MTIKHPASTFKTREERKEDALKRKDLREGRTHQEQLNLLDKILGAGLGASRERKRLQCLIEGVSYVPEKRKVSRQVVETQSKKKKKSSSNSEVQKNKYKQKRKS